MHAPLLVSSMAGCPVDYWRSRESLIGLEALIVYDIDFPEEDDGPYPRDRIDKQRQKFSIAQALLATAPAGELIRKAPLS